MTVAQSRINEAKLSSDQFDQIITAGYRSFHPSTMSRALDYLESHGRADPLQVSSLRTLWNDWKEWQEQKSDPGHRNFAGPMTVKLIWQPREERLVKLEKMTTKPSGLHSAAISHRELLDTL